MDGKIFVLLIIAMVLGFSFLKRHYGSLTSSERRAREDEAESLRTEHEALKKRVETLERIVTDKGMRLSAEIDAL